MNFSTTFTLLGLQYCTMPSMVRMISLSASLVPSAYEAIYLALLMPPSRYVLQSLQPPELHNAIYGKNDAPSVRPQSLQPMRASIVA